MVANKYVKCSVCGATIRLRIQVGYRNIPFMFYCPDCETEIKGEINVDGGDKKTWMNNVEEYDSKTNTAKYVQELSSEFLQKKIAIDSMSPENFISPFIRNMMQGGEEKLKRINDIQRYYNNYINYKNDLKTMQDLYNNKKYDVLRIKIKDKSFELIELLKTTLPKEWNSKFINQLDFLMVIHQSRNLLITNLLNYVNKENVLNAPKNIQDEILPSLEKFKPLMRLYGDNDKFDQYNQRMNEITENYMEILPILLPVISSIDEYRQELMSKEYVISYGPLFALTNLYQKMYELFCDGIDLVIGMNNVYNRGEYDKFCKTFDRISGFENIINSYSSKYKKYSELLMIFDKFSTPFVMAVHNKVRNAEGHFNRQVETNNHEIVFKDLHRGNNHEIRIDYLEFATNVVDLYNKLNVLFEYHYQLNKIYLQLYKGMQSNYAPHYKK